MSSEFFQELNSKAADEEEIENVPYPTLEDKMVSIFSNIVGDSKKHQRMLGLALMAAAGLFLTLGNSLVQYTYKQTKSKISSFQILFVRSFIQTVFTLLFMLYGKVHPYGSKKKNLIRLIAMGITEVSAIIFVYLSLEKMPVADVTVIQFTAPVFTVLFSYILLRRGCSWFDGICGLVSFVGVLFIAKPDLIYKHGSQSIHMHAHNVIHKTGTSYVKGSIYALVAALSLSLFFILNKMMGKLLDVTLTILYPSIIGMMVAPVAMFISKEKVLFSEINGVSWSIIVAVGFLSFTGLMFMGEALQLEDAGPAILIRNCDVIYAFILQYLLMHNSPTIPALIGTVIVLGCTSLTALNRAYNLQKRCCGDRCGGKCGGDRLEDDDEEETHFMLQNDYVEEEEVE